MIAQVTRLGLTVGTAAELEAARERFRRDCCLHLPGFLAADLLQWFQERIAFAEFETRIHQLVEPPAVDLAMKSDAISGRLHFLINDPRLFALVEWVSGCASIGCFLGTVYKMVPGAGHQDAWHHDVDGSRMVTLSVNLSTAAYDGGVLQIMDWDEQRLLHEMANTGFGDAILFPLSMRWRHRLTEVTGTSPKVALAGWFERVPKYADRLPRLEKGPGFRPQGPGLSPEP